MARPTKQGIDFFSIDCNFDDKTELFLMESGPDGLGVLVTIWQLIYANHGYYIACDDDLPLLIKRRVSGDINAINSVINLCLRRNLFDQKLFEDYKILTSKAVQKRYFDAAKKKKAVQIINDFLLIDVSAYDNLVNSSGNPGKSSGNATKEKEKEKEKEYIPSESADSSGTSGKPDDENGSQDKPPPKPPPDKPKPTKYKFEDAHMSVAKYMADCVLHRHTTQKINIDEWADAVRKIDTINKFNLFEVLELWDWIGQHQRGDFSWADNCRTPMKLRQRKDGLTYFEIIRNQMRLEGTPSGKQSNQTYRSKPSLVERVKANCETRARARGESGTNGQGRTFDGEALADYDEYVQSQIHQQLR